MTKNSLRALATALVLCAPVAAFAKAPLASNMPVSANAPAGAAKGTDKHDAEEHKDAAAAHKKHAGKSDSAKTDKNEKGDTSKH